MDSPLGTTDHSSQESTLYREQEGTRVGMTEQSKLLDWECPTTPEAHAVWEAMSLKASEALVFLPRLLDIRSFQEVEKKNH